MRSCANGVRRGGLSASRATIIRRQLKQLINGCESRALIQFSDDRYLEFSARRRKDKGVVLIFRRRYGAHQG